MSALATALHLRGERVQGSDDHPSGNTKRLAALGISLSTNGHALQRLQRADVLVYSSAFGVGHAIWQVVQTLSPQPQLVSRAALLAGLAAEQPSLAVAGTHGKTTTSAALAAALLAVQQPLSVFLGGECALLSHGNYHHHPAPPHLNPAASQPYPRANQTKTSPAPSQPDPRANQTKTSPAASQPDPRASRTKANPWLVCEADESDAGFLLLQPHSAIVTNVDADHLDVHGTLKEVEALFARFVQGVSPEGVLAYCQDDPPTRALVVNLQRTAGTTPRLAPYGLAQPAKHPATPSSTPPSALQSSTILPTTSVRIGHTNQQGMELHFRSANWQGSLKTPLIGAHNAQNLAGVVALCKALNLPMERVLQGLAGFGGVDRRQQKMGQHGALHWFDDYAHHPVEVEATLNAFLSAYGRPLSVVFQPHLYSRTKHFTQAFAKALAKADQVVVTEVYAAREAPIPGVSGENIVQAIHAAAKPSGRATEAYFVKHWRRLAHLASWPFVPQQGVVLTLGAGDIHQLGGLFLQQNATASTSPTLATPSNTPNPSHQQPRQQPRQIAAPSNTPSNTPNPSHQQPRQQPRQIAAPTARRPSLFARLQGLLGQSQLRLAEPLAKHTSLRVGGLAECWVEINSEEDAVRVVRFARQHGMPCQVLGNGSNVLVSQKGLAGLVLHLGGQLGKFSVQPLASQATTLLVSAGAALQNATFVTQCQPFGLAEVAFLAVIPGCLGGAVAMNAGAHGGEVASWLHGVRYLDMERLQVCEQLTNQAVFAYRTSPFAAQHQRLVLQVHFALQPTSPALAKAGRQQWLAWRRQHHPRGFSCGSVFKNPPNDHAARLIEACGLKGLRHQGAMVSAKHANFIVNQQNASADDVLHLIENVRTTVQRKTGVLLECEVRLL